MCLLLFAFACAPKVTVTSVTQEYMRLQASKIEERKAGMISDEQWQKFDELSDQIDAQLKIIHTKYAKALKIQNPEIRNEVLKTLDQDVITLKKLVDQLKGTK